MVMDGSHLEPTRTRPGLQQHLLFLLVETLPIRFEVLLTDHHSSPIVSPWNGFSKFVVSSAELVCSICD